MGGQEQGKTAPEERAYDLARTRAAMALSGALAGLALWLFADLLPGRVEDLRALMFFAALVLGMFAVLLALAGPARWGRALLGALAVAGPAALLLLWASFRYDDPQDYLKAAHPLLAYGVILFVATPFAAAALRAPGGWRDYARLFDLSWSIVVRYAAGWLFVGLFWAVLMLSDQLLQLVGLRLIERFLDIAPVPYGLTGLVLGLAMGVTWELRDYVSPYLIHRLLRLLLPMLLPVVAIFLLALPLRGLSGLFGHFSAAATLMAVALAGITLISTALDRADEDAAQTPAMLWSVRAFSLALPVLAGLAGYAVWLRVAQYGWTPERLLAALAAAFLLAYGLAYAGAALAGLRAAATGWMARIRGANRGMALALVAVAALWLTPLVNAEWIAARSQLAQARAQPDAPEGMALWEMAQAWGRPGRAALAELEGEAKAEGAGETLAAIARAREATSRYAYRRQGREGDLGPQRAELRGLLALRPEGTVLPEGALAGLTKHTLTRWLAACRNSLPDGRAGCALLLGDFRPGMELPNGYALMNIPAGRIEVAGVVLRDGRLELFGVAQDAASLSSLRRQRPRLGPEDMAAVLDGDWRIAPVTLNALEVGGQKLIPDN